MEVETTGERQGLGFCACRQLTATSFHFPGFRDPDIRTAIEVVSLVSHATGPHIFPRTRENESNCT